MEWFIIPFSRIAFKCPYSPGFPSSFRALTKDSTSQHFLRVGLSQLDASICYMLVILKVAFIYYSVNQYIYMAAHLKQMTLGD